MMKRKILLSIFAALLVAVVAYAVWYINEDGKMRVGSREAFIPYNSAVVVTVNSAVRLPAGMRDAFAADLSACRSKLLFRIADTLRKREYVKAYPYVLAARMEGKSDVPFLCVMDNKDVISKGEVGDFLHGAFAADESMSRKYDRHRIYALRQGEEMAYFAVCGGIILISDSDLYIEDGLKQFDQEETEKEAKPRCRNLNKYFSSGAGINVLLNAGAFSDLMPLYVQAKKIFPHVDMAHLFKWGALDGDFGTDGICLNGFMDYDGLNGSYAATLAKQTAKESNIDGILPSCLISAEVLNLSDLKSYFAALENYRYTTGQKDLVFKRKQQLAKMFGKNHEEELRGLLQGEFAAANLAYNEATGEREGLVVAELKSGSLGKALLEKMMKDYARFDNQLPEDYAREYGIDQEKSFRYYRFPVEDLPSVYWGYVFEGIKARYVLVEDNYLIFASSENAVRAFVKDCVHGSFVRDAGWYRDLKSRLAGKCNGACFARTMDMLPCYQSLLRGKGQKFLADRKKELASCSAWAGQWSNEGNLLYATFFFSAAKLKEEIRPHVVWQTKLEARMGMKPVLVVNHATGENELFVQDENHTVYLINDAGRILWKLPLDDRINSDVYQVDLFKNGKLQYLFSTPSKMYLIDRNGRAAGRFPVAFKGKCEQGITVFDYDGNRDYRVFAPCDDRETYLYGLDGNPVKGWEPQKADKPIVSKVRHFRIDGKDYLVLADQYRFYILDRRGKERVRVSSVFDLNERTDIYLTRKNGQPVFAFAGKGGQLYLVNLAGGTETVRVENLPERFEMNVADWDGNGSDEAVFTSGNRLIAVRLDGKVVFDKALEGKAGYPYAYRFSAKDVRLGMVDAEQGRLLLLASDGSYSKGFPITGNSPFSIAFSDEGTFFLFAGGENDTLLKYRVQ